MGEAAIPAHIGGYKLRDDRSEQFFRAIGGQFANVSRSVRGISQEI